MLLMRKHHRLILFGLVLVLTIVLVFAASYTVRAAYETIPLSCSPTSVPADVVTTIVCTSSTKFTLNKGSNYYCGISFTGIIEGASLTGYTALLIADTPTNVVDFDNDYHSPDGFGFNYTTAWLGCSTLDYAPFAPALWAADLCVGPDGHDPSGWLTLDTDAAQGSLPPVLYVAPGPDGPWFATEFMQPPYVMSYEHTAALVAWMGVATEGDLWFKATQDGTPANLASMIEDRAAHMDALCGVE